MRHINTQIFRYFTAKYRKCNSISCKRLSFYRHPAETGAAFFLFCGISEKTETAAGLRLPAPQGNRVRLSDSRRFSQVLHFFRISDRIDGVVPLPFRFLGIAAILFCRVFCVIPSAAISGCHGHRGVRGTDSSCRRSSLFIPISYREDCICPFV